MLWEDFKEHLELAINEHPGECVERLEDIRRDVKTGKAMVIEIFNGHELLAVGVLEQVELNDGRTLHVRYLQGNGMETWLDELHAKLYELAKAYGCKWISLTGRLGWKKALQRLNWNPIAIQLRAEVV